MIILSKLIMKIPKDEVPFSVYNLGSGKSKTLIQFVNIIEKNVGNKSKVKLLNMQKGDVVKTHSSIKKLKRVINFFHTHHPNLLIDGEIQANFALNKQKMKTFCLF